MARLSPPSSAARVALFQCDNLIEAHLLKGMLAQCDIDVILQGEDLVGAMGELPAVDLLVLQVAADQVELAKALLRDYLHPPNDGRDSLSEGIRGVFLA